MRNTFDPKETRNTFDSKETECICPTRENTFAKSKTVKNSQKQSKNSQKTVKKHPLPNQTKSIVGQPCLTIRVGQTFRGEGHRVPLPKFAGRGQSLGEQRARLANIG
jgi:hypothetical protein